MYNFAKRLAIFISVACIIVFILSIAVPIFFGKGLVDIIYKKDDELLAYDEAIGYSSSSDTSNWDLSKVNIVESADGVKVPVPIGYTASSADGEHTVKTGFVIYEGDGEVTTNRK